MRKTTLREFPVDNASILFLSLIRPYHTNSFRFSVRLTEPVDPEILQLAVNRIHKRFPSVIAGLRQDFFCYRQVAAAQPPQVQPDPGLLKPMTARELSNCCFRVFYKDHIISIELFHALTDGYGAITTLSTLVAEYLHIRHGLETPHGTLRLDAGAEPQAYELEDSFLKMADTKPRHLPSRFSYLPPRTEDTDWQVKVSSLTLDTKGLLEAAHRIGVTLNTLLTTVLASSIMELQIRKRGKKRLKPVRIMVPIDLRKMIGSRTLRNFSLYTLPTMEGSHRHLPLGALCKVFETQLKQQLSPENQTAMVSYNVRTQNAWYFRYFPWMIKRALMRIGYRFFGESNSSMTLTNLGRVTIPEEMRPYVEDFQCWLTPRISSPYGCTVMSFGDKLTLNMSRFCQENELGSIFFDKLNEIIDSK